MPQNVEDKIDWLNGQIAAREDWLETHGSKSRWPQHDIEAKQRGLVMLTEIRDRLRQVTGKGEREIRIICDYLLK